jgi:hypothetical protein
MDGIYLPRDKDTWTFRKMSYKDDYGRNVVANMQFAARVRFLAERCLLRQEDVPLARRVLMGSLRRMTFGKWTLRRKRSSLGCAESP